MEKEKPQSTEFLNESGQPGISRRIFDNIWEKFESVPDDSSSEIKKVISSRQSQAYCVRQGGLPNHERLNSLKCDNPICKEALKNRFVIGTIIKLKDFSDAFGILFAKIRESAKMSKFLLDYYFNEYEKIRTDSDELERIDRVRADKKYREIFESKGVYWDSVAQEGEEKTKEFKEKLRFLIESGLADEGLVRLFLIEFQNLRQGRNLRKIYNQIVSADEFIDDEKLEEKQDKYTEVLKELVSRYPQIKYFKKEKVYGTENGKSPVYRLYISPRLNASPAEVVRILEESLNDAGLGNIHHKMFDRIEKRNDQITIYIGEDDGEKISYWLKAFLAKCPPELLSAGDSAGIAIAPGISLGGEPVAINDIAQYGSRILSCDLQRYSYHTLLALAWTQALAFAKNDGLDEREADSFKDRAYGYFRQVLTIAGLNPDTMMPQNINEGKLPEWAEEFIK